MCQNKIKLFNNLQTLSLRIRKKPFFCEDNCTSEELFKCCQCDRLLCFCHLNESILQKDDLNLCLDCWESKYREEIVNFEEQMRQEMLGFIRDSFDDSIN